MSLASFLGAKANSHASVHLDESFKHFLRFPSWEFIKIKLLSHRYDRLKHFLRFLSDLRTCLQGEMISYGSSEKVDVLGIPHASRYERGVTRAISVIPFH
jgi:hypothetical protein